MVPITQSVEIVSHTLIISSPSLWLHFPLFNVSEWLFSSTFLSSKLYWVANGGISEMSFGAFGVGCDKNGGLYRFGVNIEYCVFGVKNDQHSTYREKNLECVRKAVGMEMVEYSVELVYLLYLVNSYHWRTSSTNSYSSLDCLDQYFEIVEDWMGWYKMMYLIFFIGKNLIINLCSWKLVIKLVVGNLVCVNIIN